MKKYDKNYLYNISLAAPKKGELITKQHSYNYKFGRFLTDRCGCSWIAIYNALVLLQRQNSPALIIRWLEKQPPFSGLVLNGLLGGYPRTISKYFKEKGYKTKYSFSLKAMSKNATTADVNILFYLRRNLTGHFAAFAKSQTCKDCFDFYNVGAGVRTASLETFKKQARPLLSLAISIYK